MFETLFLLKWPLAGVLVAALPLAYYGVFLLERRMVFVSVTLAQAAMAGAAAASFLHADPRATAFLATSLVIAALARGRGERGFLPGDAVLGVLYVVLGGVTVILLSRSAHGGMDEATLLFGSLLGVVRSDVWVLLVVGAAVGAVALLGHRWFLATAFDPETSEVLGYRVALVEAAFFGGLGLMLSVSIRLLGVLLSFALLVLPAAAARSLSGRSLAVFVGAQAAAAGACVLGTAASVRYDLPTGAAICLALALPLAGAWVVRRVRDSGPPGRRRSP
ncbi:MAG: metal ABC transporter permease [Acidobacteriota bacterium]